MTQVTIAPLPLKVKFAKEIGTRIYLRRYWGDSVHGQQHGYHNAMLHIKDVPDLINMNHHGGNPEDYPDEMWPTVCEECGTPVPSEAKKQVFNKRWYNTESGNLKPGDMWYVHWYPNDMYWDDKIDPHLLVICPDGEHWNIDSRAKNCTMKEDRNHRCWCRHGDPETGIVHVDKNGKTCAAGAGSIQTNGRYHGFLHNGMFT